MRARARATLLCASSVVVAVWCACSRESRFKHDHESCALTPVGVPLFLLTYFGFTITINVFLRWILRLFRFRVLKHEGG